MKRIPYLILGLLFFLLHSCATKKEVLYFQDAEFNQPKDVLANVNKIQENDILSVKIGSEQPEASALYNFAAAAGTATSFTNIEILKLDGYLVTSEGTINLPVIGKIMAKGKTIEELRTDIEELLSNTNQLTNADVMVRVMNAKVTVLGEVKAPGTFSFTEQRITLPQALGYAGDLTINGKREDVIVIREVDGQRTINHIDMTKTDWFSSPYYYISQNDVIYVSPNTAKVKSAGIIGNAATVLTLASVMLSAIVLITR